MANFKEHDVERPTWLGEAWYDSSWHNDALPHATLFLTGNESDGPCIEFWVNYPEVEAREVPPRYMAVFQPTFVLETSGDVELYAGEDETTARTWARAAEIAKTIIVDLLAKPALLRAHSFSELHDYCDANVLGAQEAFLDECGHGEDKMDTENEAALSASLDVLNHAQKIVDCWLKGAR